MELASTPARKGEKTGSKWRTRRLGPPKYENSRKACEGEGRDQMYMSGVTDRRKVL